MTLEALIAWVDQRREAGEPTTARIAWRDDSRHTGYLGVQHSIGPGGSRARVYVRDSSRKRNQYYGVLPRHLEPDSPVRLEIKVGNRYQPADEVL